jgi:hypothetical protein
VQDPVNQFILTKVKNTYFRRDQEMNRKTVFAILLSIIGMFSASSFAEYFFQWQESPRGYYARVRDTDFCSATQCQRGTCETGITVFHAHDRYGAGWRIAFDSGVFINLNLPDRNPQDAEYRGHEEAMIRVIETYYPRYKNSRDYANICASQCQKSCY